MIPKQKAGSEHPVILSSCPNWGLFILCLSGVEVCVADRVSAEIPILS